MSPTFLVIGAAKAGTTSLCALLGSHPDVFMTDPKETNFFAYDELFAKGREWYETFYRDAGGCHARGEGSPLYTIGNVYPEVARRIAGYDPTLKLVFIARHPLRRIESGWLEMRSWGDETVHADFNRALRENRDWLIESTRYSQQLDRYREFFPDEQLLVVFFEDFVEDPQSVLSQCFAFLGVDDARTVDNAAAHLNPSSEKRVRRSGVSMLRSVPGVGLAFTVAKMLLPEAIRKPVRERILNKAVSGRPTWSPEMREWVLGQVRDDCYRLLDHCGKPHSFWDLDASADQHDPGESA